MNHVRQLDACGCLCASLAMVTGRAYAEVRDHAYFRGVDWAGSGITHDAAQGYLTLTGFAGALLQRWLPGVVDGRQPTLDPWPPRPFAPAHIIAVNGGRHAVVWLRDGTVLDPITDRVRSIAEVGEVAYALGVWRVGRVRHPVDRSRVALRSSGR